LNIQAESEIVMKKEHKAAETMAGDLRKQAEEIFREKAARMSENIEALSLEENRQILHELRVHQIELEMQNEELRRVQSELEASRARYFDLYDLAPVGYCTLNEQGLILEANLTAATLLGVARSALVKQRLTRFILPEDQDIYYRHRKQLFETGAPQVCELRMMKNDGAQFWGHLAAAAAQNTGGAPVCRVVMTDITERKRMEVELLKVEKLESVGILAGGIAHDFNNILTSISGNISMAKMLVKPGHKIFDLLISAETASVRAQGLTMQLLTFAKGGTPVKETASIQKLIRESSLFVVQGSKSGCEFQMAEDLWPVEADLGQISQVISNIVINANQAMPEGGIIRITAENLMPEKIHEIPVKPGRYIRISIKDQGVGIVEKHLSKIFDPYFTTKQTGSGLGLATTYSIIKKHNGHISVDSLPGAGTTFDIYLPASDKEIPVKEEALLLTGRGKILIMDDDELLKELADEMLNMLGYESEFAKDGDEAVEMYKKAMASEKPYDAVILDLTIPGSMGGEEVIKILLNIDPEVKAIVFSGYSEGEVMSNFRKYGFKGMMPKPFDAYALGKALNDVLKAEVRCPDLPAEKI
jgi:PAS domain S-box-containing protein